MKTPTERDPITVGRIVIALAQIGKNVLLLPVRFVMFIVNAIGNTFRFSLTYRIGLIYTALTMVALILFNLGFINSYRYLWQQRQIEQLEQTAARYVQHFSTRGEIDLTAAEPYIEAQKLAVNLYDANLRVISTNNPGLPSLRYNIKNGKTANIKSDKSNFLITTNTLTIDGQMRYLQVVKDITDDLALVSRLAYIGAVITLILLAIIIYIGSKVSVSLLRPIVDMTDQIKQITVKKLDFRLDSSHAQDELKELTLQFNRLLDKIEDAYSKQNQFVSDASHELRTPISVINGYAAMLDRWGKRDEAILDEAIGAIKGETQQMTALIEKLLFLARSDRNKIEMEIAGVDLSELIAEICRETEMIDNTHQIHCAIAEQVSIFGNAKMIKQMMRIFIENALKFTEADGDITIGLERHGVKVVLYVKDTGIGIAKSDLPKVFDRFYRTDKSRTKKSGGSGLGLSIAKWIIDQHQATAKIYSELGVGTKVEIWFKEKMTLVSEDELANL